MDTFSTVPSGVVPPADVNPPAPDPAVPVHTPDVPAPAPQPAGAGTTPAAAEADDTDASGAKVGDVVVYDDYDYVTTSSTERHGLVLDVGEVDLSDGAGGHYSVPALTIGWLGPVVQLPAHDLRKL